MHKRQDKAEVSPISSAPVCTGLRVGQHEKANMCGPTQCTKCYTKPQADVSCGSTWNVAQWFGPDVRQFKAIRRCSLSPLVVPNYPFPFPSPHNLPTPLHTPTHTPPNARLSLVLPWFVQPGAIHRVWRPLHLGWSRQFLGSKEETETLEIKLKWKSIGEVHRMQKR